LSLLLRGLSVWGSEEEVPVEEEEVSVGFFLGPEGRPLLACC
jgi:hypothetical protein